MLTAKSIDESARAPAIDGDEHVPLMVQWTSSDPVIFQFTASGGSVCCELKISSIGGRITGITVLNPPSISSNEPQRDASAWEEPGVPRVSLDPFDLNPDLTPQTKLVKQKCIPKAYRYDGYVEIAFERVAPVKWVSTDAIGFGVDESEQIVSIRVLESSIPQESALSAHNC